MLGRIGSYEIAGVVGSGGMGVVMKAFDSALDRYVAIKTLCPMLAASGSARKRFSREARAAAAVVHDNVIEIYGVAEANDLPYLRQVVGEGGLGVIRSLDTDKDYAAAIEQMFCSKSGGPARFRASLERTRAMYAWSIQEKSLASMYDELPVAAHAS